MRLLSAEWIRQVRVGGLLSLVASLLMVASACGKDEKDPKPPPPPVPTSIEWSMNTLELDALEATAELEVVVLDENGEVMEEQEITWLSLDEGVVEVDETGLVVARANGETEIEARVGEAVGRLPVTVRQQPTVAKISPEALRFDALEVEAQIAVDVRDRNDFPVPHAEAVWRSEDEDVATVDIFGVVTSRKHGETTVRVEIEGSTAADSIVVTVVPEPVRLALPSFPEAFVAGTPQELKVAIVDSSGHPVVSAQHKVNVGIGENPSSGRLFGVRTVNAVEGIATFPDLFVDKVGRGYTLVAWIDAFGEIESPVFDVAAGDAAALRIVDWKGRPEVSGEVLAPVSVQIEDKVGNPVEDGAQVRIALAAGPAGATLSGTLEVQAVNGRATFSDLALDIAGTYQFVVEADGLGSATSPEFMVGPGAVTQLAFLDPPANTRSNAVIAPAVRVELRDQAGNRVHTANEPVTVVLGNANGASLSGQIVVDAVAGVATFSTLSVDKAGTYTLIASVGEITQTSSSFDVVAGSPARLAFSTQPSDVDSGVAMSAVSVQILDAAGNPVDDATGTVTMTLAANPAGATLSGTRSANVTGGVATFSDLRMDKVGQGYTLRASADGLASAESGTFAVRPGAPSQLAFVTEPGAPTAGLVFAPAVRVEIRDAAGNHVTNATHTVNLSLGKNPAGGTLTGGGNATASNGVATFGNLRLNKAGTGYTLVARIAGVAETESRTFDVHHGTTAELEIVTAPSPARAGEILSPIRIEIRDNQGNLVRSANNPIEVSLQSVPAGATLSGTKTRVAENGVVVFDDLSIDKAAAVNVLTFSDLNNQAMPRGTLPFAISAGEPARLVFTTQPGNGTAGQTLGRTPVVQVQDAFGNVIDDADHTVTIALGQNPGGSELRGAQALIPTAGEASFGDLALNKAGHGYTLIARAAGLAEVESQPFSVIAGTADHLVFVQEPSNVASGAPMSVRVAVHDAEDNVVTTARTVSLALGSNPGNATLSGAITDVATVDGIATFSGISLDKAGQGYTLRAISAGLSDRESARFNIHAGAAKKLAFLTEPSNARAGEALQPAVQVAVFDAEGNRVQGATSLVRIELLQNPGGAQLAGGKTAVASNGVATFPGLSLDKAANGYQLVATADGLEDAESALFDVTSAGPARLAFRTQPGTVTAGDAFDVELEVRDAAGNFVDTADGVVRLSLGHRPAGASLSGATIADVIDGVATFTGLSLDKADAGYTLIAEATGLSSAESQLFAVEPGAPAGLAFQAQPRNVVSEEAFEVQVRILDAAGNFVPDAVDEVALTLGQNPGGATLDGAPAPVAAVGGVATFSGLSLDKAGQGFTLIASGSMGTVESQTIDVVAGAFAKLAFLTQPQSATADDVLAPVKVELLDAAGNRVRNVPQTVALALETVDGSTLRGDLLRETVNGVATFDDLSIDRAGTGYRLVAVSGSVFSDPSDPFDIHAGRAARLAFVDVPTEIPSGAPFDVEVEIQDREGNRVETANDAVSLGVGVGDSTAFFGSLLKNATNGRVLFEDVWFSERGSYTLRAFANVLVPAESQAIEVVGRPTALVFESEPPPVVFAGEEFSVAVRVLDEFAAPMTDAEVEVTLDLAQLQGVKTVTSVNGLATFSGLSVEDAGGPYTIVAEAAGLIGDASSAFDVLPGAPAKMAWTFVPSTVVSKVDFEPTVHLYDEFDNEVALPPTETVTVELDTSAGDENATLAGVPFAAVLGAEAKFSLNIDLVGTYRLIAKYGTLEDQPSSPIVVEAGDPDAVVFLSGPEGTVELFEEVDATVAVVDAAGNRTNTTDPVSLSFICGETPYDFPEEIDSNDLEVEAVDGVATFTGIWFDTVRNNCRLVAAATGLDIALGETIDIVPVLGEFSGLTYAWIRGGTFTPGCATGDTYGDAYGDGDRACEGDEPTETLPSFWMMQTLVTVADYFECVDDGACAEPNAFISDCKERGDDPDHPINCVTYEEAGAFCAWAGGALPTEIEWEYAARSGRDVVFPWGDDAPTHVHANFDGEVGETTPVGSYPTGRSFWGLLDMAGNVNEWVIDSVQPEFGYKMGGNLYSNEQDLRTYIRRINDNPTPATGFRCMMSDTL